MTKVDFDSVVAGYALVLKGLGIDWQNEPHMQETPRRAAKAMIHELCGGMTGHLEPPNMTTFPLDGPREMVISRHIPVRSLCAHHLLPFVGEATVAYIPSYKLVGLSKLSRVVEYMARRPQVQEKLTSDVAAFLMEKLSPMGVAVTVRAKHMCMELRGALHASDVVTSALRGEFESAEVRAEYLSLAEANGK